VIHVSERLRDIQEGGENKKIFIFATLGLGHFLISSE